MWPRCTLTHIIELALFLNFEEKILPFAEIIHFVAEIEDYLLFFLNSATVQANAALNRIFTISVEFNQVLIQRYL